LDISEAMLERCREKLADEGVSKGNVTLICKDTADLALGRKFGLITAPFRVFQNIESDEAVAAFFECVRRHLSPQGACILNVFKPRFLPEELLSRWQETEESFNWEQPYGNGLLKHFERRKELQRDPLVLYPELIYRYYENDSLIDEVRFVPPMRVYYAEEFKGLIRTHGFEIIEAWGGYRGEAYGEGSELVVKFRLA
jgi:cyclopropane fatty-acyl-phospholipid synthase-like methyltransferase